MPETIRPDEPEDVGSDEGSALDNDTSTGADSQYRVRGESSTTERTTIIDQQATAWNPRLSGEELALARIEQQYQGEGLVVIDTTTHEVVAVTETWDELDDILAELQDEGDLAPEHTTVLECYG